MKLIENSKIKGTHRALNCPYVINPRSYILTTDLVKINKELTGRLANQMDNIASILQKKLKNETK